MNNKELANALFAEKKLIPLLKGKNLDSPALPVICFMGEDDAEKVTAYARSTLLPFFKEGEDVTADAVNQFAASLQNICSNRLVSDIIGWLGTHGLFPDWIRPCPLCGEYYDQRGEHDCEFVRFLMGEQPKGFCFPDLPQLDKEAAEKTAAHAKAVFVDAYQDEEGDIYTDTCEFLDWLLHLPGWSENKAECIEKAFQVIYYLQEKTRLIPDSFELCRKCKRLYDADEEGVTVNSDTTVVMKDECGRDVEVYAHFPRRFHGCYCDDCRPDTPHTALLYHLWESPKKLHAFAAVRMEDIEGGLCPYRSGQGYCPQCGTDAKNCSMEHCPLGRPAKLQDLFLDEVEWTGRVIADKLLDEFRDYLVVPALVYNALGDNPAAVKDYVAELNEEGAYYLVIHHSNAGKETSCAVYYSERMARSAIAGEMDWEEAKLQVNGVNYTRTVDDRFCSLAAPSEAFSHEWAVIPIHAGTKAAEDAKVNTYCFTFGTDIRFPYFGGWVEVEAPSMRHAQEFFRAVYSDRTPGTLNCADCYRKDDNFLAAFANGNFGKRCHAKIPYIVQNN